MKNVDACGVRTAPSRLAQQRVATLPNPQSGTGSSGGKHGSGNIPLVLEATIMAVTGIVSYTQGRDIEPESIHLRYGIDTIRVRIG